MEIEEINPDFSVTGQITPQDVATLHNQGFQSVICNRPDNEKDGQPDFSKIADEASQLGLSVAHVPVIPNEIRPDQVLAFREAVNDLPKPILAYCFSGGRAKMLWSMIQD